ncbi:hypothetical protein GCM10007103_31390 [Salinimicrobium marinum]|uniref:MobA-like NTP transferase domain-containing protein n=2 Tax=Salinimicrobium marinum TaxID=680283 RepID=A0A918SJD8_9FLAO|nr:hypothetical protein GCM10007103_31390 [Salinimicrobium marinum]
MKRPKQLLPFRETTLLGHTIEQAEASQAAEVFVVLGANAQRIKTNLSFPDLTFVENKQWEEGIGASISTGVKYIAKKKDFDAVLLMLGDQPLIDSVFLDQMIGEFSKDPSKMVATKYPESKGVPALFPKKFFPKLLLLKGDTGAKSLLNDGSSLVTVIDAGRKILDIDTPEDYLRIDDIL